MKKREKGKSCKSDVFFKSSKSAVIALLLIAAAVAVYSFADAAVVSHPPSAIQPQGAGSGLDSGLLGGLSSAEILAVTGQGLYGWAQVDVVWCNPDGGFFTLCSPYVKPPAFCSKDGTFGSGEWAGCAGLENQVANCSEGYAKVRLGYTCRWQEIGGVVDTECQVIRYGDKQGYFSCYKLP